MHWVTLLSNITQNDAICPHQHSNMMCLHRDAPSTCHHHNYALFQLIRPLFQSELKKASRVRAVLQEIVIPQQSYKKNLEEIQKQFESKTIPFHLWDQGFPWSLPKF